MPKKISNHVVEVRYKPNPTFLDKRGEIANSLIRKEFNHWNITANRIKFTNEKNKDVFAFIGFKNLGFSSNYPNKISYFLKNAQEFIKSAWDHFPSDKITRVGVRSEYFINAESFHNAFDSYKNGFVNLEKVGFEKLTENLVDIGIALDFAYENNLLHIVTGPMKKEEFKSIFNESKPTFKAAYFIDVDFFREEFSQHITQKNLLAFIETGLSKTIKIQKKIYNNLTKVK